MSNKLWFGINVLNKTQGENVGTHQGALSVDYASAPAYSKWYNAHNNNYKVLNVQKYSETGFYNTVYITPCTVLGTPLKVLTASGIYDYITISLTHTENLIVNKGDVIVAGNNIYEMGSLGISTGDHIHLDMARGLQTEKILNDYGYYILPRAISPSQNFFIDLDFTTVVNDYDPIIKPGDSTFTTFKRKKELPIFLIK